MNIEEALELFEIEDIVKETTDTLKIKFRKLSKKYHPDNLRTGDARKFKEAVSAHKMLLETLDKLKKIEAENRERAVDTIIIPFDKLFELYKGNVLKIRNVTIDKSKLKNSNTILLIDGVIIHNGIEYKLNNVDRYNINDRYTLNCDIIVDELDKEEELEIKLYNKTSRVKMKCASLKLALTFEFNVLVNVNITKKLVDKNDKDDR